MDDDESSDEEVLDDGVCSVGGVSPRVGPEIGSMPAPDRSAMGGGVEGWEVRTRQAIRRHGRSFLTADGGGEDRLPPGTTYSRPPKKKNPPNQIPVMEDDDVVRLPITPRSSSALESVATGRFDDEVAATGPLMAPPTTVA